MFGVFPENHLFFPIGQSIQQLEMFDVVLLTVPRRIGREQNFIRTVIFDHTNDVLVTVVTEMTEPGERTADIDITVLTDQIFLNVRKLSVTA